MKTNHINPWLSLVLLLPLALPANATVQLEGKAQLSAVSRESGKSWLDHGWSNLRFDSNSDSVQLSRLWLDGRIELADSWSAHISGQYVPDPTVSFGLTEAYLQYKPLSASGYQFAAKVGGFYPAMSLENPQFGWSSPYNYSFSAINAWLGEEVRTFGSELSITRLGKRFRSAHDISAHVGFFKGNDPAGTMLAWRGFAVHDRQSMFNERVAFPPVRSLQQPQLRWQANEVEPFSEVDGKWGYYTGVHWDYQKRQQLRVYWYDNHGDSSAINYRTGQYAWDTKFLSVAWLYKFDAQTRVIAQWLDGNTAMGKNRGVDNDLSSYFVLVSHQFGAHRVSARAEHFNVKDRDGWVFDPNQSAGRALTLSYRFNWHKQWQGGVEWLYQHSEVDNRAAVNLPQAVSETQWRVVLEYQFDWLHF
ncbi:hypothetical protein ACFOEE_13990 [Pseudoalteromonas fenneropenaei]|uniref:Porin n=2 Tax=Pseudoalteromonas fenneropenaei TaxID=1737459 RepID=A0ABV7CLY9_9GAMM